MDYETNQQQNEKIVLLVLLVIAFSLVGFIDASYLTYEHYRQVIPPCSILNGCEDVLQSEYAVVGPIPVALVGALYYFAIFIASILYKKYGFKKLLYGITGVTTAGFLASLYFVYLQIMVIESLCFYCLISATTTTILFILLFILNYLVKDKKTN